MAAAGAGIHHQLQSFEVGATSSAEEESWYNKHKKCRPTNELLWKEFFRDPSQWWENRTSKVGPKYPDFKHKVTKQSLWMHGWYNPSWVTEELRSPGFALSSARTDASAASPVAIEDETAAFVALLRACTKSKDLYRGTRMHNDILKRGLLEKCSDALETMYAKCGELGKAKALLDKHKSRNVFTWTALIAGYARKAQGRNALDCFECMQREGIPPNAVTYCCILKACASIRAAEKGKEIHDEIAKQGLLQNDIVLGNALVDMYAKCGALSKAQDVLEKLPSRNVVSWNALIAGYAQEGQGDKALNCFEHMKREGVLPDVVTYVCILKACATIGAADKGKEIHDEVAKQGLLQKNIVLVGNALVDMYAKCGSLSKAQDVLEKLPCRDVVSWTALIAGYAQDGQGDKALKCFERMECEGIPPNVVSWTALITGYAQEGQGEKALNCFERMKREGVPPNAVTYICILKACATIGAADKGKEIHDEVVKQGLLQKNIVLGNALVDMYAKCGSLSKAQEVLEKLPSRDVVSWNALIAGYAQEGQGAQAMNCFEGMQREGIPPNVVSWNALIAMPTSDYSAICALLSACWKWGDVNVGRWAFEQVVLVDKRNEPAYVLMANIYAAAGMQENAKSIETRRIRNKAL